MAAGQFFGRLTRMIDHTSSIERFLDELAARQPAPGGGSVAALTGALSAAMGQMCISYSLGKKDLAAHQDELQEAMAELGRARAMLLELMAEDQLAYEALTELRKLPAEDVQRAEKLPAALLVCIRVPETMAGTGLAILQLCQRLAPAVNRYLLSDLAVCAELAMATVRCGTYNVRVNLADLPPGERGSLERQIEEMTRRAVEIVQQVVPAIWRRMDEQG
jgi:methenyltetrahydrofolate cyclohydrolase